jgi:hypothetical protein
MVSAKPRTLQNSPDSELRTAIGFDSNKVEQLPI